MAPSLAEFFGTRKGVAAIAVVIVIILAIFAATWIYDPQFYVGLGIRHDPSLDSYVNALHSNATDQHPTNLTTWGVTWLNDTAVNVTWVYSYPVNNATSNQSTLAYYKESFVMTDFYGTNFASAYVGSINSTYKLTNIAYGTSGAYQQAFGHLPSTFAAYQDTAGQGSFIWQFDQFVQVGNFTRTYCA